MLNWGDVRHDVPRKSSESRPAESGIQQAEPEEHHAEATTHTHADRTHRTLVVRIRSPENEPGVMLTRSVTLVALACTTIVMAAPAGASAGACDTSVRSAAELHASITNPACEGEVIRIKPGTYVPQVESDPGDPRSSTFTATVNDLTLKGSGRTRTFLSGDLGVAGEDSDNAYHVVVVDTTAVNTIPFENLAVVHGNADIDDGPGPVFRESRGRRRYPSAAVPLLAACLRWTA